MRRLIIVHLEPDFERTAGLLDHLVKKVVSCSRKFDYVLNITSAESLTGTDPFDELRGFHSEEWIWGFDQEYYTKDEPERWIEGDNYLKTSGHEYSEIYDWMKELPKSDW